MGAYKQLLTSDIIVTPFEVNKNFTFYSSNSSSLDSIDNNSVGITRLLGNNLTLFDFDPNKDPITGRYDVVTPGTTSSLTFSITPFYTQANSIGSSSFSINNLSIVITGSSPLPNNSNTIYILKQGSGTATATLVVSNINNSSSNYLEIQNITASNLAANITLHSKNTGYINNFNYFTSASTTTYFSGGTNDVVSGSVEYQRLVYNSIKQLYYSNYSTSSYSDLISQPVLIPGRDEEGNRLTGSLPFPAYDNYLQTDLSYPRFLPTITGSFIGVLSIPNGVFGDYIQPNSFSMRFSSQSFYDDGEGNLLTGSAIVGNIIYTHGIVTLTGNSSIYAAIAAAAAGGSTQAAIYALGSTIYGHTSPVPTIVYGGLGSNWINTVLNFTSATDFTCSFLSSYNIYETQYKCTIRENEFNFTLNPSSISGSYDTSSNAGTPYGFVTESYFSPYITTVGLYDEMQNLLAIGKLSQPVPSSPTTDTTILINIDR